MNKLYSCAVVCLSLVSPAHAGPCFDDSYAVGPYLGLDGQVRKLNLKSDKWAHNAKARVKPYAYLGLKVSPAWALELGSTWGARKAQITRTGNVLSDVSSISASPALGARDAASDTAAALGLNNKAHLHKTRAIDLRAIYRAPLDEDTTAIAGLGMSHVKVSLAAAHSHFKKQRLVPSALLGLEHALNDNLALRGSLSYVSGHGLNHAGIKVKQSLTGNLGLVFKL